MHSPMNVRVVLLGVAVAVIGAAIWFFALRDGGDAADGAASTSADPAVAETGAPARDVPAARAPRPVTPRVALPTEAPTRPGGSDYTLEDGSQIRDHRAAGAAPMIKPALPHPSQSPVSGAVTAEVMKTVRPVVLKCLRDVPESAYGPGAVVMVRAVFSIEESGELRIAELGTGLSEIDEAAAAGAVDCVKAQASSLTTRVDHAAVESATIAFPVRPLDFANRKSPRQ